MQPIIRILLSNDATAPTYATADSAGMDLRSIEGFELAPGQRCLVRTGLCLEIPQGYEGQVRPRSGLALKYGLTVLNSPGTIDSDYRGELSVILINLGENVVQIGEGERIAQLVIAPVARAAIEIAEALSESERGQGGFGSTGSK